MSLRQNRRAPSACDGGAARAPRKGTCEALPSGHRQPSSGGCAAQANLLNTRCQAPARSPARPFEAPRRIRRRTSDHLSGARPAGPRHQVIASSSFMSHFGRPGVRACRPQRRRPLESVPVKVRSLQSFAPAEVTCCCSGGFCWVWFGRSSGFRLGSASLWLSSFPLQSKVLLLRKVRNWADFVHSLWISHRCWLADTSSEMPMLNPLISPGVTPLKVRNWAGFIHRLWITCARARFIYISGILKIHARFLSLKSMS